MTAKSRKKPGKPRAKPKQATGGRRRTPPVPTPSTDPAEKLLDMRQAIRLLKTTRPTFYRWLRAGKIKGLKVGRQWRFEPAEINRFLRGEAPRIELRTDITPLISTLEKRADGLGAKKAALPETTGVERAVAQLIRLGLAMHAGDIHIQPHPGSDGKARNALVRYRVDGVLHPTAEIDMRLWPAIVEQWKRLAACNPQETRRPQDGMTRFDYAGKPVDVRVCFLPAALGETLTARILHHTDLLTLEQIHYAPADRKKLLRWIEAPWGLLVLSGPTGSGKTTVLYACLMHVNDPTIKVMTVEDPVEYLLPGLVQVQVNEREGVTFSSATRYILRSDPDVIMIGELRGQEPLHMALASALSGHLVLTTLHADDAPQALVRMIEMGGEPFVVGDATKLVMTQRLVRLLCPQCSEEDSVPAERLVKAVELARAGGLDWDALPKRFRKAVGCDACRQIGYRGRNVIAEMLEVTPEIGQALRRRASVEELRAIAVGQDMTTMAADGVRRAAQGETTLDEVLRVLAGLTASQLKA